MKQYVVVDKEDEDFDLYAYEKYNTMDEAKKVKSELESINKGTEYEIYIID